jgi:uncharacterized protein (DUF488 family)
MAAARELVLTVGHSTRPLEEFLALLAGHGVTQLVDIRSIPRSRHNPQYDRTRLPRSLEKAGIQYVHMPGLGGRRRPAADSINTAWRNASFRGYADYMQTPEFAESVADLIGIATARRTAIMCAEAVPWRCHRSLVSDALIAQGVRVEEIVSATETRIHTLIPWARVEGTQVTYPADPAAQIEMSLAPRWPETSKERGAVRRAR